MYIISVTIVETFTLAPIQSVPIVLQQMPPVPFEPSSHTMPTPTVPKDVASISPKPGLSGTSGEVVKRGRPRLATQSNSLQKTNAASISSPRRKSARFALAARPGSVSPPRTKKPRKRRTHRSMIFLSLFMNVFEMISCFLGNVSKEIDAIKTRVCHNCGKMFDSVIERTAHSFDCTPFQAKSE